MQEKRNWHQFVFNKRHDLGIGLNAKYFDSGFRLDGSMKYPVNKESSFSSVAEYKKELLRDNYRFSSAYDIDLETKSEFEEILQELNDKNTVVICIILPFYPNFYKAIQELPTHATFFRKFEDTVMAKGNDTSCYNFSFIDLPNPDKYFLDHMHPSELMMQLIVNKIGMGNKG